MKRSRFGVDQIIAVLKEQGAGMPTAEVCGRHAISSPSLNKWKAKSVAARLRDGAQAWMLLDVCDADERAQTSIAGSQHIYFGERNESWKDPDGDRHYALMCASGMRATIAAGWLVSRGFAKLDVHLESMGAFAAGQSS